MSTVATVSLAVIAATCLVAVGAFVAFLVYLFRLVRRAEAVLQIAQDGLPDLLRDARAILTRLDREVLCEVVRTVERVSTAVGTSLGVVTQMQTTARRLAQSMLVPRMATAAGVFSAIREGLHWFRPTGNGKRR
jgi:hypothetical protein